MVKQYPHTLAIKTAAAATRDNKGNWIPEATTTQTYSCRWEPAPGEALKEGGDGKKVERTGIVFLPKGPAIPLGTEVSILSGSETIATGMVKGSITSQLNRKLYLQ